MKIASLKQFFALVALWLVLLPAFAGAGPLCPVCGTEPRGARFVVTFQDGRQAEYGCPRCALADADVGSASKLEATDFLSRRKLEAKKAFYLQETGYGECCGPYWLAFEYKDDAERFAKGFGGKVLTYEEAVRALQK